MSAGVTGRGLARAPGRSRGLGGSSGELVLGDAEVAQALEAAEPRELLDPRGGVVAPERRAERAIASRHDWLVEAQRRRQAERVQRPVRQRRSGRRAPAPARAPSASPARRAPRPHAARPRGAASAPRGRAPSRRRAAAHSPISRAPPSASRRSRCVRRRRAPRRSARARSAPCRRSRARQVERQLRLVDDRVRLRAAPPPRISRGRVSRTPKNGVHSAPGVRGRNRDERQPARGRRRLRGVDRAAAADARRSCRRLRRRAGTSIDATGLPPTPRNRRSTGSVDAPKRALATRNGRVDARAPRAARAARRGPSGRSRCEPVARELDERVGDARRACVRRRDTARSPASRRAPRPAPR